MQLSLTERERLAFIQNLKEKEVLGQMLDKQFTELFEQQEEIKHLKRELQCCEQRLARR